MSDYVMEGDDSDYVRSLNKELEKKYTNEKILLISDSSSNSEYEKPLLKTPKLKSLESKVSSNLNTENNSDENKNKVTNLVLHDLKTKRNKLVGKIKRTSTSKIKYLEYNEKIKIYDQLITILEKDNKSEIKKFINGIDKLIGNDSFKNDLKMYVQHLDDIYENLEKELITEYIVDYHVGCFKYVSKIFIISNIILNLINFYLYSNKNNFFSTFNELMIWVQVFCYFIPIFYFLINIFFCKIKKYSNNQIDNIIIISYLSTTILKTTLTIIWNEFDLKECSNSTIY